MNSQQLENLSSRKAPQSNKLAVFSSIENRRDILEARSINDKHHSLTDENMMKSSQNIRPPVMDSNSTKRYSISQQPNKDSFYAIQHTQRSTINKKQRQQSSKNISSSSPRTSSLQQAMDLLQALPSKTLTSTTKHSGKKSTNNLSGQNRGRKRLLAPDQNKSSTAADFASSPNHTAEATIAPPVKRNRKSRQRRSIEPTLYQTCDGLWPAEQDLGDFSHDNIKALSNLLKVRLCQAKFKMMAKLDQDNELFTFLAEEYVRPRPRQPVAIKLSSTRQNRSTISVVGNGKNLFNRNNHNSTQQQYQQRQEQEQYGEIHDDVPSTPNDQQAIKLEFAISPQRIGNTTKTKERKKRTPRTPGTKVKRPNATPKRKSAAADIAPITLDDGSSVFICEPCNKKYKNRGGLAYHLERCKYSIKNSDINQTEGEEEENDDDEEKKSAAEEDDNTIHCTCGSTNEHGTMIQCDKCRSWLHSECVGLSEEDMVLEDNFVCSYCRPFEETPHTPNTRDLLQCLLEAQASDYEQYSISSQERQSPPVDEEEEPLSTIQHSQDPFNALSVITPIENRDEESVEDEEEEEDELLSMPMDFVTANTYNNDNEEDEDEVEEMKHQQDEQEEEEEEEEEEDNTASQVPSQLHVWDDFSFAATLENAKQNNEPWSAILDEENEAFSTTNNNYETDIPSSSCWSMNDIHLFSQPPSLLFSDATISSALEEVSDLNSTTALIGELVSTPHASTPSAIAAASVTPMSAAATPINNISTPCNNSVNTPIHTTGDGLWFQFANFDDDYQEN